MAAFGDVTENALLEHLLKAVDFAPISSGSNGTIYVGLHTAAFTDSDSGTTNEVAQASYGRGTITLTEWSTAVAGTISNNTAIAFAQATAEWGTVGTITINTHSVGAGTVLFHGALNTSKIVGSGDTFQFGSADLDISLA